MDTTDSAGRDIWRLAVWLLAAITIACAVVMLGVVPVGVPEGLSCAYGSPVVCAELPGSTEVFVRYMRESASSQVWQWHLRADMVFLVGYTGLLVAAAVTSVKRARWGVVLLAVAAGLLDALENIGIMMGASAPEEVTDGLVSWVTACATAKFFLLAATVVCLPLIGALRGYRARFLLYIGASMALVALIAMWFLPAGITLSSLSVTAAGLSVLLASFGRPKPKSVNAKPTAS